MSFQIFNLTEGIPANEKIYETEEEAIRGKIRWYQQRQGMRYVTASGFRVDVERICLEVQELTPH